MPPCREEHQIDWYILLAAFASTSVQGSVIDTAFYTSRSFSTKTTKISKHCHQNLIRTFKATFRYSLQVSPECFCSSWCRGIIINGLLSRLIYCIPCIRVHVWMCVCVCARMCVWLFSSTTEYFCLSFLPSFVRNDVRDIHHRAGQRCYAVDILR